MAKAPESNTRTPYLYRSVRENGRVVRQYIGKISDPVVQVALKQQKLRQAEQEASLQEVREEQAAFKQLQTTLATLTRKVSLGVAVSRLAARSVEESRGGTQVNDEKQSETLAEHHAEGPTKELLQYLSRQAKRGNENAAERLRQIVRANPDIWKPIGDLSRHVEESLISMIAGDNLVLVESLRKKLVDLRESFGGDGSAVDTLLVDHVVVTWLEAQYARIAAAQPQQYLKDARFWEERSERASKRHLAAIRELTELRQLQSR